MKPYHLFIYTLLCLVLYFIRRFIFCVFVSIQFRDKIVLIVVYESLNVQYPLCSNPGVHQMILSRFNIHYDERYSE
jgi:hypothetical protein